MVSQKSGLIPRGSFYEWTATGLDVCLELARFIIVYAAVCFLSLLSDIE